MLILDNAMLQALRDHNDITYTVDITLAGNNAVDITLTENDLISGGCQITRTNDSDSFPIGYVYCAQLELHFFRKVEYDNIDFNEAVVVVHGVYEYGDEEFDFDLGTYTIADSTTKGEVIELVGYDDVHNADAVVTDLVQRLPMLATEAFEACCTRCGINFDPDDVPGSAPASWDACTTEITLLPEGITYRQLMAQAVLLFGANAYISPFDNNMYVVPIKAQNTPVIYWGGYFDSDNPYSSGDALNGGTFDPWSEGDTVSGSFTDNEEVIYLDDPLGSPELALQDITIDGVKTSDGTYSFGAGYLLNVDISVYVGSEQDVIDTIGAAVRYFTFRPFEIDYSSFPFADLMQQVMFADVRGRAYNAVLTHIDIALKGASVFKCTAESLKQLNSVSNSVSARVDQARIIADQALAETRQGNAAVTLEVSRFSNLITNSLGVFTTMVTDQSGAVTTYMHDSPALADSTTIWRMNAGGFSVSTDGGQTWTAGIDSQGRAVVNVLSTVGLYADWIVTGMLSSLTGNSSWNLNTGVFISTENTQRNGFRFNNGSIELYYDNIKIGTIGPLKVYDYDTSTPDQTLTSYRNYVSGRNVLLGTTPEGSSEVNVVLYINGDNTVYYQHTYRYTEKALFFGSVRCTGGIHVENSFKLYWLYTNNIEQSLMLDLSGGTVAWVRHNTIGGDDWFDKRKTIFKDVSYNQVGFAFRPNAAPASGSKMYEKWFVDAFISVYGSIAAESVTCTGAVTANYVGSTSDERLKNVLAWDERYDRLIDQIEPIRFTFKDDSEKAHIGVSAQKVLSLLDDLGIADCGIVEGSEDAFYSVAYNELTTLLIRKVKKQQSEIKSLQERMERLEKIVEGLI